MSVSWQDRLDDASNVHDVVEIARDFLATWDRFEVAALPEACRPGKIFDANDVTSYAFQLRSHECENDWDAARLIHKMASFFSNASARLSQILGTTGKHREGEPHSSS